MKYHDKGFINYFDDHIHLQLLNIGTVVLDLYIYEDKICTSILKCLKAEEFNKSYLNSTYQNNFMYTLFQKKKVRFQDKKNKILIKIK